MSRKSRPMKWLREATVEEIGEALLAVDPLKAMAIGTYVQVRAGPEIGHKVEVAVNRARKDPAKTVGRLLGSLLSE